MLISSYSKNWFVCDSIIYSPIFLRWIAIYMSRNALLEKIKRAEEVAASEVEKAEKERTTAMNRIPLDQEALLKEKKEKAEVKSKTEIDEAMKEIGKQKSDILAKGSKTNSKMKKEAQGKIDSAANKFVDKFLESLT